MEAIKRNLNGPLTKDHFDSLSAGSGIDQDVIAERGYRTIEHRSELTEYPEWQRRAPSLYIPMFSPDGNISVPQIRPDRARRSKDGKPVKYESPTGSTNIIDVHPRNADRLQDASIPLWIVEGIKKGDCLTSLELLVVSLTGVFNYAKDGVAYECWQHVPLQGRTVNVAFDSDCLTNPNVGLAMCRLARLLIDRGATVNVAYLPAGPNGEKVGVDDFIAGGGTVADLVAMLRPFDEDDFVDLRLSRDERLAAMIREARHNQRAMPSVRQGENTIRNMARLAIDRAGRFGKPIQGGVRFYYSKRDAALDLRSSPATALRALNALVAYGFLAREVEAKRKKDDAAAYVLRASLNHSGKKEGETLSSKMTSSPSLSFDSPHCGSQMRAPENPDICSTFDAGGSKMRAPEVPELRWSGSVIDREIDKFGNLKERRQHLARLGKKRQNIAVYLRDHGGEVDIYDLMEVFASPRARKRDFVQRTLKPMMDPARFNPAPDDPGSIIGIDGDTIFLAPEWSAAIENHREIGKEDVALDQQRSKIDLDRKEFRDRANHPPADEVPPTPETEDMSKVWAYHPDGCRCEKCSSLSDRVPVGDHPDGCYCRSCHTERRTAKKEKRAPRVVYTGFDGFTASEPEPEHDLGCDCLGCSVSTKTYARAYSGAGKSR